MAASVARRVCRANRNFQWRDDGPARIRYAQAAIGEFLRDSSHGREALLIMEVSQPGRN